MLQFAYIVPFIWRFTMVAPNTGPPKKPVAHRQMNLVSGSFRFKFGDLSPQKAVETLVRLTLELSASDHRWQNLRIRAHLKDKMEVRFEYRLNGPDYKKTHAEFNRNVVTELKRRFGKNFTGWEHACPTWVITKK